MSELTWSGTKPGRRQRAAVQMTARSPTLVSPNDIFERRRNRRMGHVRHRPDRRYSVNFYISPIAGVAANSILLLGLLNAVSVLYGRLAAYTPGPRTSS
jgi:hypothetical protein